MAKRGYALAIGAGIFYDEQTDLKVLPGKTVLIDKDEAGARTLLAIQNNHLVEAKSAAAEGSGKSDNKEQK